MPGFLLLGLIRDYTFLKFSWYALYIVLALPVLKLWLRPVIHLPFLFSVYQFFCAYQSVQVSALHIVVKLTVMLESADVLKQLS